MWLARASRRLPAAAKDLDAGSYRSTAVVVAGPAYPAATRTVPSVSPVAVAFRWPMPVSPETAKVREAGSYSSAAAGAFAPPATSTRPFGSSAATW